jgi:cyclopropane-fatty-acyl-phospholipid synthase
MAAGMRSGFDMRYDPLSTVENRLMEWRSANRDVGQARENARAHYGLGEPFYRLWLDEPLRMYTCGYWGEGTRSLEQAQSDKIDHVPRSARP